MASSAVPAHRRRALRRLTVAAVLVATTITCAPSSQGVEAAGGSGSAAPSNPIVWSACPGSTVVQCGTLDVPVDWSRPRGARITLALARRPADDQAHSLGTLFFNPGGPGDGASGYVINADAVFSVALRQRFDIVGMDPRGVGNSTRAHCSVLGVTPDDTLFPANELQFQRLVAHNRAVGQSCLATSRALMTHADTRTVARDHEALRIALGVPRVTWLGLSYGTQVAANYADLYPGHTRAMALDAALDHSQSEVQQVADEMASAEESFNRFSLWCNETPSCALHGRDVAALFDRLVSGADRHPIPVAGALRAVTGEDIRMGTKGLLRLKYATPVFGPDLSWDALARAISAATSGDASPFALPPAEAIQDQLVSQLANGCMDYVPQITTYAQMRQRLEMARQLAPHLQGASETWQVNRCIGWPAPAANPPHALDVRGVPALVVHATHDPSDPYKWAHSLAAQIAGSAVLTRVGDGHTSYFTSTCARDAIDSYLTTIVASASGLCVD